MTYDVEQHIALRRVAGVAASPCGGWLAVTVQRLDRDGAKYVSDLWKVPVDGSPATQLTRGESRDAAPCFRRDGSLAFLSNRQPNEIKPDEAAEKRMQVWLLPVEGGEPRQLTDEPLGVEAFRFARNADRLVMLAPVIAGMPHEQQRDAMVKRDKNGPSVRRFSSQPVRHWDHWLHENADLPCTHVIACDAEGANRVDLTPDARGEFAIEPAFDLSADGARVVIVRRTPGRDREQDLTLQLIDIASGSSRYLGVADNVIVEAPAFSPDGASIAAIHMTRSAAQAIKPVTAVFDVATGAMRHLAAQWDRWPNPPVWRGDGKALYVTADDGGQVPVFAIDAANGTVARLTAPEVGGTHEYLELLSDGRIACVRSTLLDAPECYVIAPQANALPQPLARLSGFKGASDWAEVESLRVPSTDGAQIQTFLVKPKRARGDAASSATRPPLLLWIHGGPMGMDQDGWHWRWNPLLMVAQGYAVALPNPRGSTGFGQAFIQGIWGNVWGDQCYKDLMAVTDALVKREDIDGARSMAMGGSFGGYMTNWIGTQTDRFKCLVTHASIVTMAQFTGVTDHPAWWYLEMGGEDPYGDRERFDRYAPIRHVKQWKTPVLIIHGERDYRCPVGEGLNLFEALQHHRVPSELLIFPDENHWIMKPRNIVAWYEAVLEFIDRHLRPQRQSA